jgi:hypothetical protein
MHCTGEKNQITAFKYQQFHMKDGTLPGFCFLEEDVMRSVTFFSATEG